MTDTCKTRANGLRTTYQNGCQVLVLHRSSNSLTPYAAYVNFIPNELNVTQHVTLSTNH